MGSEKERYDFYFPLSPIMVVLAFSRLLVLSAKVASRLCYSSSANFVPSYSRGTLSLGQVIRILSIL